MGGHGHTRPEPLGGSLLTRLLPPPAAVGPVLGVAAVYRRALRAVRPRNVPATTCGNANADWAGLEGGCLVDAIPRQDPTGLATLRTVLQPILLRRTKDLRGM